MIDRMFLVEKSGETPGVFANGEHPGIGISGLRAYFRMRKLDLDSHVYVYVNEESTILVLEALKTLQAFCTRITFCHLINGEWQEQDIC